MAFAEVCQLAISSPILVLSLPEGATLLRNAGLCKRIVEFWEHRRPVTAALREKQERGWQEQTILSSAA
jgi:hypothetical protein